MIDAQCLNDNLRRSDRAMDPLNAARVLENGEYGTLCMTEDDGAPYAVQINYVYDGKKSIYIHSALCGHKIECLMRDPRVCFSVTGECSVLPKHFSEAYESVLLRGVAVEVTEDDEKQRALKALIDKYSPDFREKGYIYAQRAEAKTRVFRIEIKSWSAKRRPKPSPRPASVKP